MALRAEAEGMYRTPLQTKSDQLGARGVSQLQDISHKIMTRVELRRTALSGTPVLGLTRAKKGEKGSPPSRAKAAVIREHAVRMPCEVKNIATSGKTCRQMAPGTEPVAWYIEARRAPELDEMTSLTSVMENSRHTRKMKDDTLPMITAATMAMGALM